MLFYYMFDTLPMGCFWGSNLILYGEAITWVSFTNILISCKGGWLFSITLP